MEPMKLEEVRSEEAKPSKSNSKASIPVQDGNGYLMLGWAARAMKKAGLSRERREQIQAELVSAEDLDGQIDAYMRNFDLKVRTSKQA
jgi:hypothetical protein